MMSIMCDVITHPCMNVKRVMLSIKNDTQWFNMDVIIYPWLKLAPGLAKPSPFNLILESY